MDQSVSSGLSAYRRIADFFANLLAYNGELADSFSVIGYGGFGARHHSGFESPSPLPPGEPLYGQTHRFSSTHKIWHDSDHRSRVTVPVRPLASDGPGLKPERVVLNAYPNPFERSCVITTNQAYVGTRHVSLGVFDMMGRRVWTGALRPRQKTT